MTEQRTPVRDRYDACIALGDSAYGEPWAHVIAKLTYRFDEAGHVRLAEPEPLFHDFRDESLEPRLRAGTDYWPFKVGTDFVVQGSAYPSVGGDGRTTVSASIGELTKRIAVFGRRWIEFGADGAPRITAPERFDEMPLTYENAYGGLDWRAPLPTDMDEILLGWTIEGDHPGMYPRNPFGKGYLVDPGPVEGMEMPNLEDPGDLLTPERLIVRDPRLWYRQPLPWCFDWMHPMVFPRHVFFGSGVDAWYPGPQDEDMPEVRRAFLAPGYRDVMSERAFEEGPDSRWSQEASLGLVYPRVRGGERVRIGGMHRDHVVFEFELPRPPRIEIQCDSSREAVEPRLHSVVCRPGDGILTMTYAAERALPRRFIPGIHKTIPVGVRIDGDSLLLYDTPPTVHSQLEALR